MGIFDAIKNLFGKHQPEPEQKPELVQEVKRRIPKSLDLEYKQNFQTYYDFNSNHRPHQKQALKHLVGETVGQISIPTGTGKTRIQVDVHINDMIQKTEQDEYGVYVIGAHRLALCSQLLYDIIEIAIPCGLSFDILYVGSERFNNDRIRTKFYSGSNISDNLRAFDDKISQGKNTTSQFEVLEFVRQAKDKNRHVIVVSTYHSFHKLQLLDKINICTFDEAHITVGDDFNDNISKVLPIIENKFFFTATRKVIGTIGGMNNTEMYGEELLSIAPRKMIDAGEIVPPLIHSIKISEDAEDANYDNTTMLIKTIIEGFTKHKEKIKQYSFSPDVIGAKLLISCSGSKELKEVIGSETFKVWSQDNNVKVLSFSSNPDLGYHFNFDSISRNDLFDVMDKLEDSEDAILFHIDILTEGIDLPSITGVMPLRNLNQSKLIQTIGRASRLLRADRTRLYSGEMQPSEKKSFIKPFCWFLVPQLFDTLGDYNQMKSLLKEIMRTYELSPEEFSRADAFLADPDAVLPKVTPDDFKTKKEKECNLIHVVEEIIQDEWNELMSAMTPEEREGYIMKELETIDA